jgi:hypothetical protein
MKEFLVKISSFLLAFLVLISTFSFTVDSHYCGDFLIEVSFTGETECCGMKMDTTSKIKKKNCCKDEVQKIEGQDELKLTNFDEISFKNQQLLTTFLFSHKDNFSESQSEKIVLKDFPPPEIYENHQVSYQTFLI